MKNAGRLEATRRARILALSNPVKREQFTQYRAAARPILDDLAELGYDVETLDDLRHLGTPWRTALPVLLKWLPKIDHPDVKEGIIRGLSVPWIGNRATKQLIEEFKKCRDEPLLAWTIGNALSIVDVRGFEKEIIELAKDSKYGKARQMVILGLGHLLDPEAEDVALSLLEDVEVKIQAVIALGKLKSRRALPRLEELIHDKSAYIRREVRKAIANIRKSQPAPAS